MDRIRSLVVGVDFSPAARTALREALRIAAWNRAHVQAVHALDPVVAREYESAVGARPGSLSEDLVDEVEREWRAFNASVEGAEDVPFAVEIEAAVPALLKRVERHAADLLVLGTRGNDGVRPCGAVAKACVRRATADVLLVREDQPSGHQNVVVGVDFSDTSRAALAQAARVALQEDAFLHVVHVFELPWTRLRRAPPVDADTEARYRQALPVRLREFADSLRHEMGVLQPEFAVVEAPDHGRAVAQYASDLAAPLVVLGTRGRTNLHELLVGSTAERVLEAAPCSILAVRPAEERAA